jgi:hypothetical protein
MRRPVMMAFHLLPSRQAMAMQTSPAFISILGGPRIKALFGLFIGHITANIMDLGLAIATNPCLAALGICVHRHRG